MPRMTGGQAVVASLLAHDVDVLFGIISVHNLHIFDALYDHQDRIRLVGGRHEHAVGFMADGYTRATGRPGVMLTSTGPGAADSVGAMGEAYHSSIPLLHITTNVEQELVNRGRGSTHEPKDQLGMFSSVAGWTASADSVEAISDRIHEAFLRLRTAHPRPAVLEIPFDLLEQHADVEVGSPLSLPAQTADQAAVDAAIQKLLKAKRPVIWVGNGVMTSGGTDELRRLAEALDCPVAATDGGKGVIPDDHPLSLGSGLGRRIWGENPIQDFIGTCDVALVVGTSLPYRPTTGVGLRFPRELIHIDIDPQMFGRNHKPTVSLAGDARAVLGQMLDALGSRRVERDDTYKRELQELKQRVYQGLQEQYPNQLRVWEEIRQVLPRDAIVVADVTVPASTMARCFPVYQPRTYLNPHGWMGLGYGFPAALGAKLGCPDRPVVAIVGDGGFQYNMQEMGTAIQYGIAPVVLMFNDDAWGAPYGHQERRFNGRFIGTELLNPDFVRLAEAYGIQAARVSTLDALLSELDAALGADRIRIIEVTMPGGFAEFR